MKTEKQIRQEQLLKAQELAQHYFATDQNVNLEEDNKITIFCYASIKTLAQIVMMRECDSIGERVKEQFTKSFQEVTHMCWSDFLETGDESCLLAGMMTYAVIVRDSRELLKQQEVE